MRLDWTDVTVADNFQVVVFAGTQSQLEQAMSLAFNGREARFYAETKKCGLILMESLLSNQEQRNLGEHAHWFWNWGPDEAMEMYTIKELPFPMSVGPAIEYVLEWWDTMSPDLFHLFAGPKRTAHSFKNVPGFAVSTGDVWNHIGPHHGAICSIKPHWMWVGK